mmetsp:Transcript_58521/g.124158  ORF Transcript_58521/g.124158 Transcript_58521/m.124158 type:complete len:100 (-) Transcript_58521:2458-2757(-)
MIPGKSLAGKEILASPVGRVTNIYPPEMMLCAPFPNLTTIVVRPPAINNPSTWPKFLVLTDFFLHYNWKPEKTSLFQPGPADMAMLVASRELSMGHATS